MYVHTHYPTQSVACGLKNLTHSELAAAPPQGFLLHICVGIEGVFHYHFCGTDAVDRQALLVCLGTVGAARAQQVTLPGTRLCHWLGPHGRST